MNLAGLVFVLVGAFSLGGALFDWNWFMESRKARFFVNIMGRDGARLFYGLLGSGFAVVGFLVLFGVVSLE